MAGRGGDADGARFADVLRHLRGLASSCEPPIGVGSFDVLYASDAEIVVWYAPVRQHQQAAEVAIPAARLAAAWQVLMRGETLDEAALEAHGGGPALGRWLLALLAQLPGVRVCPEPLALDWSPPAETPPVPVAMPAVAAPAPAPAPASSLPRRRRARTARPG